MRRPDSWLRVCTDLFAVLGTINSRRPWGDDWDVASTCIEHAYRHRSRMHDADSPGLRQTSRCSALADGGPSAPRQGNRPALVPGVDLRRNSALDLFSRTAPHSCINGRLF